MKKSPGSTDNHSLAPAFLAPLSALLAESDDILEVTQNPQVLEQALAAEPSVVPPIWRSPLWLQAPSGSCGS